MPKAAAWMYPSVAANVRYRAGPGADALSAQITDGASGHYTLRVLNKDGSAFVAANVPFVTAVEEPPTSGAYCEQAADPTLP